MEEIYNYKLITVNNIICVKSCEAKVFYHYFSLVYVDIATFIHKTVLVIRNFSVNSQILLLYMLNCTFCQGDNLYDKCQKITINQTLNIFIPKMVHQNTIVWVSRVLTMEDKRYLYSTYFGTFLNKKVVILLVNIHVPQILTILVHYTTT